MLGDRPLQQMARETRDRWRDKPPEPDDRTYERINAGFAGMILGVQRATPVAFIGAVGLGTVFGLTIASLNRSNTGGKD